ncbi:MAG TPA: hypothetical protein VGV57_11210 [Thermoleophilaceae bacterium]|nr:hypothetical protein [Thermoleophilaceae bacterium]
MQRDDLRTVQAPLKERYTTEPAAARITLSAAGMSPEQRSEPSPPVAG